MLRALRRRCNELHMTPLAALSKQALFERVHIRATSNTSKKLRTARPHHTFVKALICAACEDGPLKRLSPPSRARREASRVPIDCVLIGTKTTFVLADLAIAVDRKHLQRVLRGTAYLDRPRAGGSCVTQRKRYVRISGRGTHWMAAGLDRMSAASRMSRAAST